jgi:hypothetical protein
LRVADRRVRRKGGSSEDVAQRTADDLVTRPVDLVEIDSDAVRGRRIFDRIDADAAVVEVVATALPADDRVVAAAGMDDVIAVTGMDGVVAAAGGDVVVAAAGFDLIVAAPVSISLLPSPVVISLSPPPVVM